MADPRTGLGSLVVLDNRHPPVRRAKSSSGTAWKVANRPASIGPDKLVWKQPFRSAAKAKKMEPMMARDIMARRVAEPSDLRKLDSNRPHTALDQPLRSGTPIQAAGRPTTSHWERGAPAATPKQFHIAPRTEAWLTKTFEAHDRTQRSRSPSPTRADTVRHESPTRAGSPSKGGKRLLQPKWCTDASITVIDNAPPLPSLKKKELEWSPARAFVGVDSTKFLSNSVRVPKAEWLQTWLQDFEKEKESFSSIVTYCEAKLAETESDFGLANGDPAMPHAYRTAVCCELFDQVCTVLGRYKDVMTGIKNELYKAVFVDPSEHDEDGFPISHFQRVPYFTLCAQQAEARATFDKHRRALNEKVQDAERALLHAHAKTNKFRVKYQNCQMDLTLKSGELGRADDEFKLEKKKIEAELVKYKGFEATAEAKSRALTVQVTQYQKAMASMVDGNTHRAALDQLVLQHQSLVAMRETVLSTLKQWRTRMSEGLPESVTDRCARVLLEEGEEPLDLVHMRASELVLRWANYHLLGAGHVNAGTRLLGFGTEWASGEAFGALVQQLVPNEFTQDDTDVMLAHDTKAHAQTAFAVLSRVLSQSSRMRLTEEELFGADEPSVALALTMLMQSLPRMVDPRLQLMYQRFDSHIASLEFATESVSLKNRAEEREIAPDDILNELTGSNVDYVSLIKGLLEEINTAQTMVGQMSIRSHEDADLWAKICQRLLSSCISIMHRKMSDATSVASSRPSTARSSRKAHKKKDKEHRKEDKEKERERERQEHESAEATAALAAVGEDSWEEPH